jgi:hypothetical protein
MARNAPVRVESAARDYPRVVPLADVVLREVGYGSVQQHQDEFEDWD